MSKIANTMLSGKASRAFSLMRRSPGVTIGSGFAGIVGLAAISRAHTQAQKDEVRLSQALPGKTIDQASITTYIYLPCPFCTKVSERLEMVSHVISPTSLVVGHNVLL